MKQQNSKKPRHTTPEERSGMIDANRAYTINAFCKELGIIRRGSAYNRLIAAGLPIRHSRYILGRDFIELLGRDNVTGCEEIEENRDG